MRVKITITYSEALLKKIAKIKQKRQYKKYPELNFDVKNPIKQTSINFKLIDSLAKLKV